MSTSDLYAVYKTKAVHLAEFRNGHGTGPAVWGYINEQYLGRGLHTWGFGDNKELWSAYKNPAIPYHIRLCHMFTYDNAIAAIENIGTLSDALIKAGKQIKEKYPEYVCHFESIGEALKTIKTNKKMLGIGLSCTSVSDPWEFYKGENKDKLYEFVNEVPQ